MQAAIFRTHTARANGNQVFQTKFDRFKLRDPTKSGHLKILVVYLIDPNRRIMSISMVPCQRRDWWARDIRQKVPVLRRLPIEVFDNIIDVSLASAIREIYVITNNP